MNDNQSTQEKQGSSVIILNASHLFLIIMTSAFFLGLLTNLGRGGDMRAAVTVSIFLVSNVSFFSVGIGLLIVGRSWPVSLFNKLIPWITMIAFTVAAFKEIYEPFIGPVTDRGVAAIGIGVGIVMFALTIMETVKFSGRVLKPIDSDKQGTAK